MPRKKRIIKNPPFDTKCKYKHCDRKIPKSFVYCSSECRRQDLGVPTPKYISTRNAKKKLELTAEKVVNKKREKHYVKF